MIKEPLIKLEVPATPGGVTGRRQRMEDGSQIPAYSCAMFIKIGISHLAVFCHPPLVICIPGGTVYGAKGRKEKIALFLFVPVPQADRRREVILECDVYQARDTKVRDELARCIPEQTRQTSSERA